MSNNNLSGWLVKVTVAGLLVVAAMPAIAQAQNQAPSRGVWLAASSNQASLSGNTWGRLTMVEGVLAFESSNFEWRLALSEIKRVAASKELSNALEIESVTRRCHRVSSALLRATASASHLTDAHAAAQREQRRETHDERCVHRLTNPFGDPPDLGDVHCPRSHCCRPSARTGLPERS